MDAGLERLEALRVLGDEGRVDHRRLSAQREEALEQAEAKLGKWKSLQAGVQKTYERVEDLKDRGYMPLMRFGPHTVTVRDIDTKEVVFFGMYETQAEANRIDHRQIAEALQGEGEVLCQQSGACYRLQGRSVCKVMR